MFAHTIFRLKGMACKHKGNVSVDSPPPLFHGSSEEGRIQSVTVLAVAPISLLPERQLLDLLSQGLGSSLRVNQMERAGGLESKISPSDTVMWEVIHSMS